MRTPLDWDLVDEAAARLGVSDAARKKWRLRDRGIPPKWWLPITRVSRGKISLEALEASKERVA